MERTCSPGSAYPANVLHDVKEHSVRCIERAPSVTTTADDGMHGERFNACPMGVPSPITVSRLALHAMYAIVRRRSDGFFHCPLRQQRLSFLIMERSTDHWRFLTVCRCSLSSKRRRREGKRSAWASVSGRQMIGKQGTERERHRYPIHTGTTAHPMRPCSSPRSAVTRTTK